MKPCTKGNVDLRYVRMKLGIWSCLDLRLWKQSLKRLKSFSKGSKQHKADKRAMHIRRALEYVRVILMKSQLTFGKKGKLSPRYIRSFQILKKLGLVVYRVALPPGLEQMHNVFHVSMLRGYLRNPFHVIDHHQIALDDDMIYEEKPIQIIDRQVKQLKNKSIPMVKLE
ncbi:uncharacterized protein LOC114275773 [Camellia sinensis]|uniref:uncharacterized protein LOC114275773 n=1 Tax=Camellia sinensis TaxID=4442 RepID=UPI001036133D|nr:uncharacterized protein LOC114275773 [Camellia sinensis]